MSIFAIADLHLSFGVDKPMNIFGSNWENHAMKIKANWLENISDDDTILLPGDISWAMRFDEAQKDLDFIENLPGKKVIISGNHDYWWTSASKLNSLFKTIYFLKNDFFACGDIAICGTRGWICPNDISFEANDKKIYERELIRLKLSLDSAVRNGFKRIFVITHFPPTAQNSLESGFTEIYENYNVEKVIYGHLHGKESFVGHIEGVVNNIEFTLVSSDYIDFNPKKIL